MNNKESFFIREPRPKAKIRLICFPYAGGSASVYYNWPTYFKDIIEVVSIQYPGRGNRIKEKCINQLKNLANDLFDVIRFLCNCDKHIAFFGHSMGTLVIYEIIKKMQIYDKKLPFSIFLSGGRGPNISPRMKIYDLERENFIYALKQYKNTPEKILEDNAIIDFFIPMLRADFQADETYLDTEFIPIESPLYIMGGLKDIITSLDDLRAWKRYAKDECYEKIFPGGHFFIDEQFPEVVKYIQDTLIYELNKL